MSIDKNKFLLFAAFLAAVAVISHNDDYGRKTIGQSEQKQTAIIADRLPNAPNLDASSPSLTKSQQTTNAERTAEIQTEQTSEIQNRNFSATKIGPALVLRTIDGDTIVVSIDNLPVHVRLIGIDSPELNDKRPQVACMAQKAKEEVEKILGGKNVRIEKDSTQGDYDKHNRLLAYVFVGGTNFNELIIQNGYAYEYTYHLPYKYQSEFKTAQNEAKNAQRSLWNENVCK